MTLYLAKHSHNIRIEEVEIVSETAQFVTLQSGRREKKITDYGSYFPTRQEAKDFIIRKKTSDMKMAETRLAQACAELEKANAL